MLRFIFSLLLLFVGLVIIFPLKGASFEPAIYLPQTDKSLIAYVEINSAKKLISSLKSFYRALRKGGKNVNVKKEWRFLAQIASSRLGVPLLEPKKLSRAGIDIDSKVGIILRSINKYSRELVVLLPSESSKSVNKAYQFFKKSLDRLSKQATSKNKLNRTKKSPSSPLSVVELEKNKLLRGRIGSRNIFIAVGERHLIFSNSKQYALSRRKSFPKNFSNSKEYQLVSKNIKNSSSQVLKYLVLNKEYPFLKILRMILMQTPDNSGKNIILSQTQAIGGALEIDSKNIKLRWKRFLNKDALKAKKVVGFNLDVFSKGQVKNRIGSLSLDYLSNKKMLFLSFLLKPADAFQLMFSSPAFGLQKIAAFSSLSSKLESSFRNILDGRYSLMIPGFSTGGQVGLSLSALNSHIAVGLKGNPEEIKPLLKKHIKGRFSKAAQLKFKEKKQRGFDIWELSWLKKGGKNLKKSSSKGPLQTFGIAFMRNEIIFSSGPILNYLKKSSKSIFEEYDKQKEAQPSNTIAFLYSDIRHVYDSLSKSAFGILLGQYLAYIKNVDTMAAKTFYGNDHITSEFQIKIK